MFLPVSKGEMSARNWSELDVILVSGDAYLDTPYSGIALIGRVLEQAGYRVGIVAQPETDNLDDIRKLGAPKLFWGISAGCVDSMVANYTATGRKRKSDDFTPGGINNRRPDRASIVYANLIRRAYKPCAPIVLGGIEASLRRIAHYDFWSDRVRRSILFDAKADILVYGMAERTIVMLADKIKNGASWKNLPGICYWQNQMPQNSVELPPFAQVAAKSADGYQSFMRMFSIFSGNQDSITAKILSQKTDDRWLIHNPPAPPLETAELDNIYGLPYEYDLHPEAAKQGKVTALDTIRFSLTTHRGCYGACNFCAIAMHQGRRVTSRSEESILSEAKRMTKHPRFNGIINDVGGPTANMYGFECVLKTKKGACADKQCVFPEICPSLPLSHKTQTSLLKKLQQLSGIRRIFVSSGLRYDMILADLKHGNEYLENLISNHISGQLKIAPEHTDKEILRLMGKPGSDKLLEFKNRFDALNRKHNRKQFLTYYFIAAHPGCSTQQMQNLAKFASDNLKLLPEQVQIFTPTPSTWSTAMYYTGINPANGKQIFVERSIIGKQTQKDVLLKKSGAIKVPALRPTRSKAMNIPTKPKKQKRF